MNSPLGSFLCPEGFAGPEGVRALLREGSIAAEFVRHLGHHRGLRAQARQQAYAGPHRRAGADPVLLVPGFMAGDWSLRGMAAALRHHGHRTYHAEILVNMGCTRRSSDRLERRLEAIALRREAKVAIVGHSLGGLLARGVAARRPDLVSGIVTLGSPVMAPGAVHRLLAWDADLLSRLSRAGFTAAMSEDCLSGSCARASWEETQRPLATEVGYTAVYSRRDGIVDWRSCLDPQADRQVEVASSHCGMAVEPEVLGHVLDSLADFAAALRRPAAEELPPAGERRLASV